MKKRLYICHRNIAEHNFLNRNYGYTAQAVPILLKLLLITYYF